MNESLAGDSLGGDEKTLSKREEFVKKKSEKVNNRIRRLMEYAALEDKENRNQNIMGLGDVKKKRVRKLRNKFGFSDSESDGEGDKESNGGNSRGLRESNATIKAIKYY